MAEPGPSACRAGCASREVAAPSSLPTLPVPGAAAAAAAGAPAPRLDPSALRRGEAAAGATGTGQGGRKGGREGGREGVVGRGERKVEKKTLCQKKTSLVCLMCHYVRLPSGPG